ncbi:hypothetical protein BC351_10255 [Paenibacillus ferrarius]|uniref:Uncharacterized protein n=1 Tax=Paenibacillus ferrarius TaxID=1469647 RepID=A0A1V4H8W9_9BACL|nr:hypothetical protein [Paenibacillus ferrarius]OPH47566.1 hypothetical protein BC351_10255 [Paenibacillus ferrarius]
MKIEDDIKLEALANLPTSVGPLLVSPLTLKEIIQYGYSKYSQVVQVALLTKEQLIKPEYLSQLSPQLSVAEIIFELFEDDLSSYLVDALRLFLKADVVHYKNNALYIDGLEVSSEDFNEIIRIIKIQNCLVTPNDEKFNPLNEHAARIKKKMLESKRKIQELGHDNINDQSLSIFDLISILSSHANGITIFNVFDLNMLQFNDQFSRMKLLDEYEVNIQALLHGADAKQIQLKHWISKLM